MITFLEKLLRRKDMPPEAEQWNIVLPQEQSTEERLREWAEMVKKNREGRQR